MRYETINWDEDWGLLVDPIVDLHEKCECSDRLDDKYDRRLLCSPCSSYFAMKLMERLSELHPKIQFSAHSDATASPSNMCWRLLARKSKKSPLSVEEHKKLVRSAKAILKNMELKHPEEVKKQKELTHQQNLKNEDKLIKKAKEMGMTINRVHGNEKSGCMSLFLFIPSVITVLYFLK